MSIASKAPPRLFLLAALALPAAAHAQPGDAARPDITVTGTAAFDPAQATEGPQVQGIISARSGERLQVADASGTPTMIALNEATRIKGNANLLGTRAKPTVATLINGLPVTIKTWQSGSGLVAREIKFKGSDLKTAAMIHGGTNQRFEEQTAATQALRGRMGDIDQYNVKATTNVNFDTGKSVLSDEAKAALCATASQAQATDNALLLVVGYTDARGSDDFNQKLSEQRAGRVINYLQQTCGWKPYRMLTPTGMAKADPLAPNDTPEGMAQNRRVAVNILVSKAVDGFEAPRQLSAR
jgi:outer membrane protein OmpA-like peptidoglycan-associated protein